MNNEEKSLFEIEFELTKKDFIVSVYSQLRDNNIKILVMALFGGFLNIVAKILEILVGEKLINTFLYNRLMFIVFLGVMIMANVPLIITIFSKIPKGVRYIWKLNFYPDNMMSVVNSPENETIEIDYSQIEKITFSRRYIFLVHTGNVISIRKNLLTKDELNSFKEFILEKIEPEKNSPEEIKRMKYDRFFGILLLLGLLLAVPALNYFLLVVLPNSF
ncbi:MAG: hypothetical protein ATN35_05020 [Epulopiscium sp. Nele67-Bin004]|nr:MAG: hypothetical protein ATN35_05020 [Epulopiscium sp. Nele67-Bin004]